MTHSFPSACSPEACMHTRGNKAVNTLLIIIIIIITVVVIIIELLFNYKRSFNEYQDTWPVFPHGLYDPAGEHKMRANKAR